MSIGEILQASIYGEHLDDDDSVESNFPYWDFSDTANCGAKLVFLKNVFRSKVSDYKISSTWRDLGEWLKKNMNTTTNLLTKWLESDLKFDEFREKYKSITQASKLGLL